MVDQSKRDFLVRSGGLAVGGTALLATGTGLLPQTARAASGDKFRIGAVLELSGADVTGGTVAKRGYELWATTINKAGGIKIGDKTYPVELVVQDCQSQPAEGANACERLITQEKVDVLFGSYTSGVQLAMNPIAAKYQVPCIAGSSESPENWRRHPEFTFGMIPAVDLTSEKSIAEIVSVSNPKAKTIAVVGVNEPFSKDTAEGFRVGAKKAGLQEVYYTLFPADADLSPIGATIASKKPDIVAVGGHDILLSDMVKALKGANFAPAALIEHYGITDSSFVEALHGDANGVMGISVWLPNAPFKDDLFGTAAHYAELFKAAYGVEPDYTSAGCSAAGYVLMKALEQLGAKPGLSSADKLKLNKLIGATDLTAFYGPVKFAQEGAHYHNNDALKPFLVQIQEGQVKPVAPPDEALAKVVYPLPAWGSR